jgi:hypothetical protein
LYRRGSRDGDSYGYVDDMRKSAAAAWAIPLGHDGGYLRKESPPASGLPLTFVLWFDRRLCLFSLFVLFRCPITRYSVTHIPRKGYPSSP